MGYPTAFVWQADHGIMRPTSPGLAASRFTNGETYLLAVVEERSEDSHKQAFAWLREAWMSLPDHLAQRFPTSEHMRKAALIETGFCTVQDYVCGSRAEAVRWAENLRREADEYAMVALHETVVRVFKAKSQSKRAMGKSDFEDSKKAILDLIAGWLDVTPETLSQQQAGA